MSDIANTAPGLRDERIQRALDFVRDCFVSEKSVAAGAIVLRCTLSDQELGDLAHGLLRAMTYESAIAVTEDALHGRGAPSVPFGDVKDSAAEWASTASQQEIQAYAGACYRQMSPSQKRRFQKWIRGGAK